MRVLVACEFSGVVRDAFTALGHDAMSCDILPSLSPGEHYQGDVLDLIDEPYDLVIAHPPCTYLALSGVRWLYSEPGRQEKMEEAAEFFNKMSKFNSPRIAIENPVQHRYAVEAHGLGKQTQVVNPWQFGHPERKMTCLWLYNLPKLVETDNVKEQMLALPKNQQNRIHFSPDSKGRELKRSITYSGIAAAMAEQWGGLDS